MKNIVKVPLGIFLGLLVVVLTIFTLIDGWHDLAWSWRYKKAIKHADCEEVARRAVDVIRQTSSKARYAGNDLTKLPKIIADLNPMQIDVSPHDMVISFYDGRDTDFGLKIQEWEAAWVIFSYPPPVPDRKGPVSLMFLKDRKTRDIIGPAVGVQPFRKQ